MKKTLSTIALAAVVMFGSTFANAGIIIAGVAAPGGGDPCTDNSVVETSYTGIIIAGFTGIIIAGIDGTDDTSTQACGILVSD